MLLTFLLLTVAAVNSSASTENNGNHNSAVLDPEWHEGLQKGSMLIGKGRVKRLIQQTDLQPNVPFQACQLPDGRSGHCRYLKYCIRKDLLQDKAKFLEYTCIIQPTSKSSSPVIGICCPDGETPSPIDQLAGELPATAPLEETDEAILKVSRAENRGCGLSTRAQAPVLGSRPANPREWPWIASITPYGFEQYCGGALITDRHVLTAAHCTQKWNASELFVRLGEYDLRRTNDSRSYNFNVVEIIQHAGFQLANYRHDIAMLKLHKPAVFNTYVWPICLTPYGLDLVDQIVTVVGWGSQKYKGPHSTVLMEVSVPVWDQATCVNSFVDSVFDETLCASGREGDKDSCQGDSGGPLMYQMPSGRWVVVGIVSWGIRCGEPNHPGLYTRVDKYLSWIVQNARF